METQPELDEHEYDAGGVCIRCGLSRGADSTGVIRCVEPAADQPSTSPVVAEARPRSPSHDRRIARPLAIISRKGQTSGVVEALLVPGDDSGVVIASVHGVPGRFDPDGAFRTLDDIRTRAESAYQWIADGLTDVLDSHAPAAAPQPAVPPPQPPAKPVRWGAIVGGGVVAAATIALVVAVFRARAESVITIATWVSWIGGIGIFIAAISKGWKVGCGVFLLLSIAVGIVTDTGSEAGVSRALISLLVLAVGFVILSAVTTESTPAPEATSEPAPAAPSPLPAGPLEHVFHEAEAVRYVPGLFLAGELGELAVAIECEAEDGSVVRRIVLPVDAATRENAADAVRMAKAPDLEYAAERARVAAEEEAAAAALERLTDLERSRRSLPE